MKLQWALFMASAILVLGVFIGSNFHAASGIVVDRIGPADLDALMRGKDCRCLIVAMAAWCGPCKEELPVLNKLYDRYKGQGLRIIGISLDLDGPEAMQRIVDTAGVSFPIYWAGDEPVRKYSIFAVPTLFFIKKGEVVEKIAGKRNERFLDGRIREFLGLGRDSSVPVCTAIVPSFMRTTVAALT